MNKPEKKVFKKNTGFISLTDREFGYNRACEEWEAYAKENYIHKDKLPSEEELTKIMDKVKFYDGLAKAVRKELDRLTKQEGRG